MKQQLKYFFGMVAILAFLVSACSAQPGQGRDLVDTVAKLAAEAQPGNVLDANGNTVGGNQVAQASNSLEGANAVNGSLDPANPNSADQVNAEAIVDGGTTVESSQALQSPAVQDAVNSDSTSASAPSLEQRDSILDKVNQSPTINTDETSSSTVGGPAPGTESGPVELDKPIAVLGVEGSPDTLTDTTSIGISSSLKAFSVWLSELLSSFFNR